MSNERHSFGLKPKLKLILSLVNCDINSHSK